MEFAVVFIVFWGAMVLFGMYVGEQKGRGSGEAAILTILFGPFGILIVALLPTIKPSPVSPVSAVTPSLSREEQEEIIRKFTEKQKLAAQARRQAFLDKIEAMKQAATRWRMRRQKAYLARGITPGPFAWIEAFSADLMNWFKGLSDLSQALVLGLMFAIPAGAAVFIFAKMRN